ncbi:uncharacterized protein M421DRAFT_160489 [Didymella exigua CBS 183.55]|uniref:Uncharacterized protein n=1 Tax=Didymella exigua CBS 183.55 TaxID=1150837 RepID=A0A6A5RN27_9PLEO|nr:uncharacterized protein M421DRAFT_160489 [Didymella exigua CBS 183.55]KAF1928414.1 hypothetical protein M421DRAFT_160489 [Didymella exigua CBS 183.55]
MLSLSIQGGVERLQLFDHVLRLGYSSWPITPEEVTAWGAAVLRCEDLFSLYKRSPEDGCYPLPNCPVEYVGERGGVSLPTPEPSPEPAGATTPPQKQLKRKRGRPTGAKDVMKRARRGECVGLSGAERSRRSRHGPTSMQRKEEKELQQQ